MDIQPILLQYLGDFIERFSCNLMCMDRQSPSGFSGYFDELHTFVRGNDALMYGRNATLNTTSGALGVSANWYAFSSLGPIYGKPNAVTWGGLV